jgi:hypothetical protein
MHIYGSQSGMPLKLLIVGQIQELPMLFLWHSKASVIHLGSKIFQKRKLTKRSTEEYTILLNFVSLNNGKQ